MKFFTTPYHFNLLNDESRISAFYEAINEFFKDKNNSKDLVVFDIGCGSGILTYFLKDKSNFITAVEKDEKTFKTAQENLKNFQNINLINSDILDVDFNKKADLIICEMLDTALIDEEEVSSINHIHNYLNNDFQIIPEGIINIAELVFTDRDYIHYEDDTVKNNFEVLSDSINYLNIDFKNKINPNFKDILVFKLNKSSIANGIKITTFTKVYKNIICGPTPMLNPPLFIPFDEIYLKEDSKIKIELEYIMSGGIESIKSKVISC